MYFLHMQLTPLRFIWCPLWWMTTETDFSRKTICTNIWFVISPTMHDNILKFQCLVFNQFYSTRFEYSHQYGWVLVDLASRNDERFQNTFYYCIKHLIGVCKECEKAVIIKCWWYTEKLCFVHFLSTTTTVMSMCLAKINCSYWNWWVLTYTIKKISIPLL